MKNSIFKFRTKIKKDLISIFEKNLTNFDPISRLANISGRQQFTSINPLTRNNWFLSCQGLIVVNFKEDGQYDIVGEYPYGVIDINELSGAILADNIGSENLLWLGSKDSKLISYLPNKYINEKKINQLIIYVISLLKSYPIKLSIITV